MQKLHIPNITQITSNSPSLRLNLTGDIMLSRDVSGVIEEHGEHFPWSGISEALTDCDFLVGNLECLLTERGTANPESASCFRAHPSVASAFPGFEAFTLANNHVRDYGDEGISDTLETLGQNGFASLGVRRTESEVLSPYFLCNKTGVSVALFAATSMKNVIGKKSSWHVASVTELLSAHDVIQRAKMEANVLLALIHTGHERVSFPSPEARNIAQRLVDIGFDGVICHHPHVVQGYELYHGKPILYSLGDFVFDGKDKLRQETVIATLEIVPEGILSITFQPIIIDPNFRPVPASGLRGQQILKRIESLSEMIADGSSDNRFFESTSQTFVGAQSRDWQRAWRNEGFIGIVKKLRRLRPIHAQILARVLFNRFKG